MNGFSRYDILYDAKTEISPEEEISLFFSNPLWKELDDYIKNASGSKPEISYNLCALERHWNVEYHKDGRTLCTLYPKRNSFLAMVDIGDKEEAVVLSLLPALSSNVRQLFQNTYRTPLGRWLVIEVSDKKILNDVEKLIEVCILTPYSSEPESSMSISERPQPKE